MNTDSIPSSFQNVAIGMFKMMSEAHITFLSAGAARREGSVVTQAQAGVHSHRGRANSTFENSLGKLRSALSRPSSHELDSGFRVERALQIPGLFLSLWPSQARAGGGGRGAHRANILQENVPLNTGLLPINHLDLSPN